MARIQYLSDFVLQGNGVLGVRENSCFNYKLLLCQVEVFSALCKTLDLYTKASFLSGFICMMDKSMNELFSKLSVSGVMTKESFVFAA